MWMDVAARFGLEGRVRPLPGERTANAALLAPDGRPVAVLKLHQPADADHREPGTPRRGGTGEGDAALGRALVGIEQEDDRAGAAGHGILEPALPVAGEGPHLTGRALHRHRRERRRGVPAAGERRRQRQQGPTVRDHSDTSSAMSSRASWSRASAGTSPRVRPTAAASSLAHQLRSCPSRTRESAETTGPLS